MQPTMHLKFIGGKLHQLWERNYPKGAYVYPPEQQWRLVESE